MACPEVPLCIHWAGMELLPPMGLDTPMADMRQTNKQTMENKKGKEQEKEKKRKKKKEREEKKGKKRKEKKKERVITRQFVFWVHLPKYVAQHS